jgi:hypothetical protein
MGYLSSSNWKLGRGDPLKKKFNKLASMKVGTGEPNILFTVQEAKDIRLLIIEKCDGATGSEDGGLQLTMEMIQV